MSALTLLGLLDAIRHGYVCWPEIHVAIHAWEWLCRWPS